MGLYGQRRSYKYKYISDNAVVFSKVVSPERISGDETKNWFIFFMILTYINNLIITQKLNVF